jgi:hypothetical protein
MDQPVGADLSGKNIPILTGELNILIKRVHLYSSIFFCPVNCQVLIIRIGSLYQMPWKNKMWIICLQW